MGLAHLKADGHWEVFNRDNSDLPDNKIIALLSDDQGGVWVGTESDGLAHLKADGNWEWFDTDKSGLPYNYIWTLVSDDQGGVWVGTHGGGLAHLTFGQQQSGKRAAIIITGGPNTPRNELWDTATSISNHIYKMLIGRGFVNTEIYYLSPQDWADFNGDGFNDRIVDAPRPQRQLIIEDVRTVLEEVKEPGKLDQPLYFFYIGHGGEGKLHLADFVDIEAAELKALLDDYQAVTGSQVVIVVDACHSGSFMPTLAAENRAVLTSSKAEEKSFFFEKQGWSRFLASSLFQGRHFFDAFFDARRDHEHLLGKNLPGFQENGRTQTPMFDDNGDGVSSQDGQWLKQVKINGDFVTADITLAVTGLTESANLSVDQVFSLKARASTASGQVERVWAVIRPPKMNLVLDSNGTPILAYPRAMLSPKASEGTLWESSWNEAIYNGDYEITFYAEDNEGNIASSDETVMITVSGGLAPPDSSAIEIILEKDRYQRGESFQVSLREHLNW
ncbi:Peptidase C13, legumain, partial [Candidatus Thiomargarita nelsonii]